MPDHVYIKIPKPRITLYGLLVTGIVAWGAYSIFWKNPQIPKHPIVLPPMVAAPSLPAVVRQTSCVSSSAPAASVTTTLTEANHKTVVQLAHEFTARVRCRAPAKHATAGTVP